MDGELNEIGPSGIRWVEIRPTAVEEDRFLEVLSVAISSSTALDRHDLAVDAVSDTVSNPIRTVHYDVVQSLRECAREFPHRLQSCVDHTPVPVVEKRSGGPAVGLLPEVSQQLLVRPCSPCC